MSSVLAIIGVALAAAAGALLLVRTGPARGARELIEGIDALLPQTQCGRCHYQGCRPYAEAIAHDMARINQCPPGGAATIRRLADLLGEDVVSLDPLRGREPPPQVVVIDEQVCIGCTKCIQACPVDAIVGAPKLMHTVIAAHCTGCELCIPPCPVDCIAIVPLTTPASTWKWPLPEPLPA